MRIHAGCARNGITKKTIHTGPDSWSGVLAWPPSTPYCAVKGERVAEICNCEARGVRDEYRGLEKSEQGGWAPRLLPAVALASDVTCMGVRDRLRPVGSCSVILTRAQSLNSSCNRWELRAETEPRICKREAGALSTYPKVSSLP